MRSDIIEETVYHHNAGGPIKCIFWFTHFRSQGCKLVIFKGDKQVRVFEGIVSCKLYTDVLAAFPREEIEK